MPSKIQVIRRKKDVDLQHFSLTTKAHSVTRLASPSGLYKDFVSVCITHQEPLKQINMTKVVVNVRKKRSFTQCAISGCCIWFLLPLFGNLHADSV
jgi:hypothetical protein